MITAEQIAQALEARRAAVKAAGEATAALAAIIRQAHAEGMSRYRIQKDTGLPGETVKAWTK